MATNKGIEYIFEEVRKGNVDALYKDKIWENKRDYILKRDNYECQRCLGRLGPMKHIRLKRANTVHHIIELRDVPELMLDDNNLISLCRECHDVIHGRITSKFNKPKEKLTKERW